MGRIRSVKPEVFKHDGLFDLERETGLPLRLAWIGLWTVCDREGRFPWRPRVLKPEILPHDSIDFADVLNAFGLPLHSQRQGIRVHPDLEEPPDNQQSRGRQQDPNSAP